MHFAAVFYLPRHANISTHTHTHTPTRLRDVLALEPRGQRLGQFVGLLGVGDAKSVQVLRKTGEGTRGRKGGKEENKRGRFLRAAGKAAGEGRDKTVKGSDMVW